MLHLWHKPQAFLILDEIVPKIKLLQLPEISLLVQHFRVESTELIPSQIKSLKFGNLTNSLE